MIIPQQKKFKQKKFWVIVFFVAIGIAFLAGIFFARSLQGNDEVTQLLQQSELSTESTLLEQELIADLGSSGCELANLRVQEQSDELFHIGKKLDSPDAEQRLGAKNYAFLKQKYHLLQIRTYTLYKKLSQQCGLDRNVVLFYFSRNNEDAALQGKILDELVLERNIIVFAVEYRYSSELAFLEDYYHITQTPSLVINFGRVFSGKTDRTTTIHVLDSSKA